MRKIRGGCTGSLTYVPVRYNVGWITVWENEAARNTSFQTLHDRGGRNGKNVVGIPTTVAV